MRVLLLLLCLSCSRVTIPAWSEPLVRSPAEAMPARPSATAPEAPTFPEYLELASAGPALWFVPRPGLREVTIAVVSRRGEDGAHPRGLVRFMVRQLAQSLERSLPFARIAGSATVHDAHLELSVPPSELPAAFASLAKALRGAGPDPSIVNLGREDLVADLESLGDRPRDRAWRSGLSALHREGVVAQAENARAFDAAAVVRCRNDRFAPEDTLIAVTGNADAAALETLFAANFRDWAPTASRLDAPRLEAAEEPPPSLALRTESSLAHVLYVQPAPAPSDRDRVIFELLVDLLGGTFRSRLNGSLRETHAYTYGAFASVVDHDAADLLAIRADFAPEDTRNAITEFYAQLTRMRREPLTSAEIALGRTRVWSHIRWQLEGPSLARLLARSWSHGIAWTELEERYRALRDLTPERALEVAEQHFSAERGLTVISGPSAALRGWTVARTSDGFEVRE
ncbi:MAG: insulinase family protein [Myxococcota bacterium]